jgi:hypothetical protein
MTKQISDCEITNLAADLAKINNLSANTASTINLNAPLVFTPANTTIYLGKDAGGGVNLGNTALGSGALQNYAGVNGVGVGYLAGQSTTNTKKIFIGAQAGQLDGSSTNIAIGNGALQNGSTGIGLNVLVGHDISPVSRLIESTVAVGNGSVGLTTGSVQECVAVGNYSFANISGAQSQCTAVGLDAGYQHGAGSQNSLFGFRAGYLATGSNNTYLGAHAGYRVNGSGNVRVGRGTNNNLVNLTSSILSGFNVADSSVATISNSIFEGYNTALSVGNTTNTILIGNGVASSGSAALNNTVAIGHGALLNGTVDGTSCTVVGYNSATHTGNKNSSIVVGNSSMTNTASISTITVGNNTNGNGINIGNSSVGNGIIIGNGTGTNTTFSNIAIGDSSRYSTNSTGCVMMGFGLNLGSGTGINGQYNVCIGSSIGGGSNDSGISNVLIGSTVALNQNVGQNNVILGSNTANGTVGNSNVIIGRLAGKLGQGTRNIAIGEESNGLGVTQSCVNIGYLARSAVGNVASIAIGLNALANNSNDVQFNDNTSTQGSMYLGNRSISLAAWVGGGLGTASIDTNGNIIRTPSDEKLKKNILDLDTAQDFIDKLKVKKFDFIDGRFSKERQCGFMAQDLLLLEPSLVNKPPESCAGKEGDYLSVNYVGLIPYIVRTMQEQAATIRDLTQRLEKLEKK